MGKTMDLITLIGLSGSLASIIALMDRRDEDLTPARVLAHFRRRAEKRHPKERGIARVVSDEQVEKHAHLLIALHRTDAAFLERIRKRCLRPYAEAINNHEMDEADLFEVKQVSRKCVCRNIKMAMDDAGGKFPSDEFKELWRQFDCA